MLQVSVEVHNLGVGLAMFTGNPDGDPARCPRQQQQQSLLYRVNTLLAIKVIEKDA